MKITKQITKSLPSKSSLCFMCVLLQQKLMKCKERNPSVFFIVVSLAAGVLKIHGSLRL